MNENDLIRQLEQTKEKLNKALRRSEGFKERSKLLSSQYEDAREREKHSADLVMELLERQRELNVMLNRANIMLNRAHEAMALTSVEFNEMAKALPEPKKAEWSDRVSKINDLFKKTGFQDGDVLGLESPELPSLQTDEIKRESEEVFSRKDSVWSRAENHEPPTVHAELIPEEADVQQSQHEDHEPEIRVLEPVDLEAAAEPARQRKPWWSRIALGD